jgi:hypothetical protein
MYETNDYYALTESAGSHWRGTYLLDSSTLVYARATDRRLRATASGRETYASTHANRAR